MRNANSRSHPQNRNRCLHPLLRDPLARLGVGSPRRASAAATGPTHEESIVTTTHHASDDPRAYQEGSSNTSWIPELLPFADSGWITGIHATLKRGKEGTVYCCRAHPSTGETHLAAKVYRPHAASHYRTAPIYRQGRERGHKLDPRLERAIRSRTGFGRQAVFGGWIAGEYEALSALHSAGADVPRPFALGDNVILMEYFGDEEAPAPLLLAGGWTKEEAHNLFDQIIANVEILLAQHRIHGDLSPYNVLVWEGRAILIDLPQSVDPRFNRSALELLRRDVENITQYFSAFGISASAAEIAINLWSRYQRAEL